MSGRLAAIINVALPSRVRRLSPDSPSAAPTSVWQMLSMSEVPTATIRGWMELEVRRCGVRGCEGAFAEHDRFEDANPGAVPPIAARQTRLETRVLEKGVAVPPVLDRHLGQQEPASSTCSMINPCRPTSISLTDVTSRSGVSTEISISIAASSLGRTGAKRGSESDTMAARSRMVSESGASLSILPRQPRSSPST